jgi:hypothetical protein
MKSQINKKMISKIRKSGKRNANKEMNHHLSGCKKALQQVSRNRIPIIIFDRRKKRMVNRRRDVMRKIL